MYVKVNGWTSSDMVFDPVILTFEMETCDLRAKLCPVEVNSHGWYKHDCSVQSYGSDKLWHDNWSLTATLTFEPGA
jgi:hypothetical protein